MIERVAVIGTGTMGRQIALRAAQGGLPVALYDSDPAALERAQRAMPVLLAEWAKRGTVAESEIAPTLARLRFVNDLGAAVRDADLIIEAVPERVDLKRAVWAQLDELAPEAAIVATNSSSIRVSLLEDATARPARVANLHFFHPMPERLMVEIGPGTQTSAATMDALERFARRIRILPLRVQRESTGFIINRVWRAIKKEALKVADSGVASFEDVDRAFMVFFGIERGPFALMDDIGLDVVADIERVYAAESGDPDDLPPPILTERVARGDLGVKTGRGFYTYPDPAWAAPDFLDPTSGSDTPGPDKKRE
jgi:3-hydroxybutyryl-CoA dehydrogenase